MKAPPLTASRAPWLAGRLVALVELGKPRLSALVLISAALGFVLGAGGEVPWGRFTALLAGTALVAWGIHALNQYLERDIDRVMTRTRHRPLPSGRLRPGPVRWWGLGSVGAGLTVLFLGTHPLAAGIALAVATIYVFIYTPLKRITQLNTLVGAVPGALPAVLGWAAATGGLGPEALALFLIMYVWQFPHFLPIAWLYREDFRAAGVAMITIDDSGGWSTRRQVLLYAATLVPVSITPTVIGMAGMLYFWGALALGTVFLGAALAMAIQLNDRRARMMLRISIIYLPLLLTLLVVDARPLAPPPAVIHIHGDGEIHRHDSSPERP